MQSSAESVMLADQAKSPNRLVRRARGAFAFVGRAVREACRACGSARDGERLAMAGLMLRMRAKQFLTKLWPRWQFREESLFGSRVECFGYFELLASAEIIFLAREYRFEPRTQQPRIFDCGSNIGLSVLHFKHEYPRAEITAFEPDPVTFALLRRNVQRNGLTGVALHNLALGAAPGLRDFFHDPENPGSVCMSFVPQPQVPATQQVQVARLSDYVDGQVDLLKLDVEGAELEVMEDLRAQGKLPLIREIVMEVHPNLPGKGAMFSGLEQLLIQGGFHWELRGGSAEDGNCFTIHAARAANATESGTAGSL